MLLTSLGDLLQGEDLVGENLEGQPDEEEGEEGGETPDPPDPGDVVSLSDALTFVIGRPSHADFTIGERDYYYVPVSAKRAVDSLFVELAIREYVGTLHFGEVEALAKWTARNGEWVLAVMLGGVGLDALTEGQLDVSVTVEHPEGQKIIHPLGLLNVLGGA